MEENNSLQTNITYLETQIKEFEHKIEINEDELNYFRKYKDKIERHDSIVEENDHLKMTLDRVKKKNNSELLLEINNAKSKIKELLENQ